MTEKPTPKLPEYITCEVCLSEIPESVAMSSEADEYTQYFCGIECYNIWREGELEKSIPDVKEET